MSVQQFTDTSFFRPKVCWIERRVLELVLQRLFRTLLRKFRFNQSINQSIYLYFIDKIHIVCYKVKLSTPNYNYFPKRFSET